MPRDRLGHFLSLWDTPRAPVFERSWIKKIPDLASFDPETRREILQTADPWRDYPVLCFNLYWTVKFKCMLVFVLLYIIFGRRLIEQAFALFDWYAASVQSEAVFGVVLGVVLFVLIAPPLFIHKRRYRARWKRAIRALIYDDLCKQCGASLADIQPASRYSPERIECRACRTINSVVPRYPVPHRNGTDSAS